MKKLRPRKLKPSIKQLIVHRAITQRKIPREFLAIELIKEIEESGEIPPTLETAKRYISKARNANNPMDEPWSIACCDEYISLFPPDSIPVLIKYKKWLDEFYKRSKESRNKNEKHKELFGMPISEISIRHAKWIVRLEPLIKSLFSDEMARDEDKRFGYPYAFSLVYMIAEETCAILNEDFSSVGLDHALASKDLDAVARIGALGIIASAKPLTCDNNCENCTYVRLPGSKIYCIPKLKKESDK